MDVAQVAQGKLVTVIGSIFVAAVAIAWTSPPGGGEPPGTPALVPVHDAAGTSGRAFQEPTYVGPKDGCRKCHLGEYRDWQKTPHADALERLPAERRDDPECVKCHVTGLGEAGGFVDLATTPELAGVTCEACHGPGSLYRDKETMKSREASVAVGLQIPDEATCRSCHNEQSPDFKGFDFAEYLEKGVHEIEG